MAQILLVSAVVPTRNRARVLARTLETLSLQSAQPSELIVVDASTDDATRKVLSGFRTQVSPAVTVRWIAATSPGAAPQRNQGSALSTQPYIWFFDDDILFEPNCVERLWRAIESDKTLGGVNATIVNQQYGAPGLVSRTMFALIHGRRERSFAGKLIGPAVNLLPEDRDELPQVVAVEWLNLGCTMYRREALPDPPFDTFFSGYSLMEDLALSSRVLRRGWNLANVRTARIVHDSQSQEHDVSDRARMELTNRHYVMTDILGRRRIADYLKLFLWETFQLAASVGRGNTRRMVWREIRGKWQAIKEIAVRA
jgi:GT2 family glycosyltransferase